MSALAAVLPDLVTVETYLHTMYRPDCDYVDGYLEERFLGENAHAELQSELLVRLRMHTKPWQIYAVVEQRVQVSATRFRVPDICVMPSSWKRTPIVHQAPLLCIEILSPEDTISRTRTKCKDFFSMGVPEVWIFDPEQRMVSIVRPHHTFEHLEPILRLAGTAIELSVPDLFAVLDEGV